MKENMDARMNGISELNDEQLEKVVGGYDIGDTVRCRRDVIEYCSNCGRLLTNYEATLTGLRGVLDGKKIFWATRKCCGWKSSLIETEIIG